MATPPVNIQYTVLEIDEEHHELVEKLYFDRLADFILCGADAWLAERLHTQYCDQPAPNSEEGKTCREVGSTKSFRAKVLNLPVWAIHQRAYKKYFAHIKKDTMSKAGSESKIRSRPFHCLLHKMSGY